MSVELLNERRWRTGEVISDSEAAEFIACQQRRIADLEEQLQRNNLSVDGWRRADQNCICEPCGKTYLDHPYGGPILHDRTMILHRLCDGSLVKL